MSQPEPPSLIHIAAGPFLMGTSGPQIDTLALADPLAAEWQQKGHFLRHWSQPHHIAYFPISGYNPLEQIRPCLQQPATLNLQALVCTHSQRREK